MTRLSVAVTGDSLTFRPVTSSIVRKSKDGNVDVVIMLFGSHYNISMDGIIQQDSNDQIDDNTKNIGVANSNLEFDLEQKVGGTSAAELIGSFSSFMYFYPGLKIRAHLKLPITSHAPVVPELEAHYHFKDLLSSDELIFKLTLKENNLEFDLVELVDGSETVLYNEVLASLEDEYFFEFDFNVNGKSRFYKFADYETQTQTKARKWIGNLTAKLGECNVVMHGHNDEQVLRKISSGHLFIDYPQIFLKFDRTSDDRFIGQVKVFDDMNTIVEADWKQIRSRDYKFEGNRVLENAMIRVIINSTNPDMEIYGWNFNAITPSWEKVMTMITDSDSGSKSLKIQNISFEYFSKVQLKAKINFGTSVYDLIMSRGDPYITLLNTGKLKFKFKSELDRMAGNFASEDNGYSLINTSEGGTPRAIAADGTVTCASVLAGDTFTANGLLYTAVNGAKANNEQFDMSGTNDQCATDLADSIENDTRVGIDEVGHNLSSSSLAAVVTIVDDVKGIDGNLITLLSSDGGRLAVSGATLTGGAATGGAGTETLTGFSQTDNWFSVYNQADINAVVGWMSNLTKPSSIKIDYVDPNLEYLFTYPGKGNIYGIGVLPSFPSNLVGGIPFPFVVGTQDEYVKWRANEALLSFRELETIKRR